LGRHGAGHQGGARGGSEMRVLLRRRVGDIVYEIYEETLDPVATFKALKGAMDQVSAMLADAEGGWRRWSSGRGESLREDLNPELARRLEEGKHFPGNPLRAPDGYDYWLYPAEAEPGRHRYIQRARRS